MAFESINPFTGKLLRSFPSLSLQETVDRIEQADAAYRQWKQTSFDHRKSILKSLSKLLRDRIDDLAELITIEMGKRLFESRAEIQFCTAIIDFYADGAESFLADERMDHAAGNAYIRYEPIGTLLGVMPWNFPFYQVIRFAAPNLMAGNTVMIKHACNVPQCAQAIADLFDEAGLSPNAYSNLFTPTEFVKSIIEDNRIKGVSLTGSDAAGSAVAAQAGKHIKKSVLELGGNDAFIVLEDADLKSTVRAAVKGRMRNAGQSCIASKRFIVVESIADDFLACFKTAMAKQTLGDPMDPSTDLGPLSTEAAALDLEKNVRATIQAGATVVLGGDRPNREGAFFNPTILTNITRDMPTFDHELFGPVASVYIVKDEAEAIQLANDSSYGLGGSVFTSDVQRGIRVAEQIETGMVFINQVTRSQQDLPFGGVKRSGYGRELSYIGIREFANTKLIHYPNSRGK
jgi:succinate-semialdehyde dehydrogenase/glutarate-semialdehyde dehydrogenase